MNDGLNRVILLGNLGADPDLRYTQNGTPVLNLRLATNETFVDKNREPQERTDWHQVVVWGPRAEALAKVLMKGTCVLVEGGLRTSSYEKDGQKRYKTEVHAREICLTARRPQPAVADDELIERVISTPPVAPTPPHVPTSPGIGGPVSAPQVPTTGAPSRAAQRAARGQARAELIDEIPY